MITEICDYCDTEVDLGDECWCAKYPTKTREIKVLACTCCNETPEVNRLINSEWRAECSCSQSDAKTRKKAIKEWNSWMTALAKKGEHNE